MLASFCSKRGKGEAKREKGRKGNSERGRKGYVKVMVDGGRKEDVNGMGKGKEEGQENVGKGI